MDFFSSPSRASARQPAQYLRFDRARQFQLLIIIALLAGGGGVAYGFANLAVQLAALALLATNLPAVGAFFVRPKSIALTILCTASLALPLFQIIPLSPALWTELPDRQIVHQSLMISGGLGWFPFSLDSARTLVAFLGLLLPMAIITVGASLSREALMRACRTVVAIGVAGFVLGAVQVLSSGQVGLLYPENPMPGVMFTTFANRNSAGLFMVCCLILLATLPIGHPARRQLLMRAGVGALLTLGVFLTQSRSSMVLLIVPAMLALLQAGTFGQAHKSGKSVSRKTRAKFYFGGAGLLVAALVAAVALLPASRISTSLERFHQADDARAMIWDDSLFAAKRYWPAGAGMGTFDEVFQVDESLEHLSPRTAGRAHNDYIEIAIEAGAFGLVLVAFWAALVLWLTVKARKSPDRQLAWGGAAILMCMALQSGLDYPLRNQAMLGLAALALTVLVRVAYPGKGEQP